jgi:hypothetical protein
MGFFEAVVALTSIVMVFGVPLYAIHIWGKRSSQGKNGSAEVARLNAIIGDMAADMQKLKDRVHVLERIATSDDKRLADEIERLGRSPRAGA